MNSEMEVLLQAATYRNQSGTADDVAASVADSLAAVTKLAIAANSGNASLQGPAGMAVEFKRLVDVTTVAQATNGAPPKAQASSASAQEASSGESVIRTAAMMTGVGPLVTGLLKLFGSDESEPLPALQKFTAPSAVSVEAGLTRDREYSAIRYAEGGAPEALGASSARAAQSPTIQVNIQAMDSQSFLDRQGDIARAVREAMLHSNSLNDVVLDL